MSYDMRIRRKNYCAYNCFRFQKSEYEIFNSNPDKSIPAIQQKPGFQQIKIQKGGTPQFRKFTINQFGRYTGTGGRPLSNFR